MRQVTIYTTDKEYSNFVQLAQLLPYVKRIETDKDTDKAKALKKFKIALEELQLIKAGKLKTISAKELFDELQD